MNSFKPDSFRPVTLADGEALRAFLSRHDNYFCDYNFVNLFAWGEFSGLRWQIADGRLWIYSFSRGRMFLPLGEGVGVGELLAASDSMIRAGQRGDFVFVEPDFIDANPELSRHFAIEAEPQNSDYIYLTQRLVQLSGNKLAKKKNLISQFRRLFPGYQALALEARDAAECLDLAERWCRIRSCDQIGFRHESSALKKALEYFDALGLFGIKISVDGRMVAYSVISSLSDQMADVHFEKFDPHVKGVAQVINWETARLCEGRYKYLNREQDLGIPGLRQAKKSYEPVCLLMSYFLRRR